MVELRAVDADNIWRLVRLSVSDEQRNYVATNTESILEAYVTVAAGGVALPFGVYRGEEPVGFVMFGYGTTGDEDEPAIADGNYCIWRFMIDKAYQRLGLGREALAAALAYLNTEPCGRAPYCWLSYEPENAEARALYAAAGFVENGEMCGDEIVAVRPL